MGLRRRIPSGATLLAWLGVIGTLLGIIGFFVSDLPGLLDGDQPLSQQEIVGTLSALQSDKERAELQLTQIAVANEQAANQSTQAALDATLAAWQATLNAAQAEQEAVIATQNAIAAANQAATQAAETANAVGTQAALDVTATAAAIAQIVPTDTPLPTETPLPTATPVPPPVTDYRAISSASVSLTNDGRLEFIAQAAQPIPDPPPDQLVYAWWLDTDRNPATGIAMQDIGVDVRVAAEAQDGAWIGTVRRVQEDGTLGDPFLFVDITANGPRLMAALTPSTYDLPLIFDWVIRAEVGEESYALFPELAHGSLTP